MGKIKLEHKKYLVAIVKWCRATGKPWVSTEEAIRLILPELNKLVPPEYRTEQVQTWRRRVNFDGLFVCVDKADHVWELADRAVFKTAFEFGKVLKALTTLLKPVTGEFSTEWGTLAI